MKTLVRWNPNSLLNEFDRLMEREITEPRHNLTIALDVAETEDDYKVMAAIPGVNADEIDITIEDDVLNVRGEIVATEEIEGERYHLRERRYGSYSRSVRFPTAVKSNEIEASYINGILTLIVPKAEAVKPRRIEVKSS